jgi:hypothetical protein
VCSSDLMSAALSVLNAPTIVRDLISNEEAALIGVQTQIIKAKCLVDDTNCIVLDLIISHDYDDANSYSLTIDGKIQLDTYMRTYRPTPSESDNLWNYVVAHFLNVRSLRFLDKVDYIDGTPVRGKVHGVRYEGDGLTTTQAYSETWAFEATYPWGTAGNIKSWKY